jgi:hypothetical protein
VAARSSRAESGDASQFAGRPKPRPERTAADPDALGQGYPATVDVAGRTPTPAVLLKAVTYWPGVVHARRPRLVDLAVLPVFFSDLLGELPWWNTPGGLRGSSRLTRRRFTSRGCTEVSGGRRLPSPQATDSSLA